MSHSPNPISTLLISPRHYLACRCFPGLNHLRNPTILLLCQTDSGSIGLLLSHLRYLRSSFGDYGGCGRKGRIRRRLNKQSGIRFKTKSRPLRNGIQLNHGGVTLTPTLVPLSGLVIQQSQKSLVGIRFLSRPLTVDHRLWQQHQRRSRQFEATW
jgi:hypothetical protein